MNKIVVFLTTVVLASTCYGYIDCNTAAIPPPDVTYVDVGYLMGGSDGSSSAPWTSIQDGIDDADDYTCIYVREGTYSENIALMMTDKYTEDSQMIPGVGETGTT